MFLFLLILLLPSQLSHHFWPSWSLINGIRSDYLSPTIYFTDLIIAGIFLISRLHVRIPIPVIIFVVLNIFFSINPLVSIYKWIRVYEYYWLFKYLISRSNYTLNAIRYTLPLAVLWTAVLAWWQFSIQHSVGGLWYWLGERTFSISTPSIAKLFLDLRILNLGFILRPYATMPHPNALAGFLLVSGLILYFFNTSKGRGIGQMAIIIAGLTVLITFSKSAILIEIALIILWLVKKYNKLLLILFIVPVVLYFYLPSSPNSIPERILLNQKAVETIQKLPLFGVGLGNSVSLLPSLRQPTHNIFLLLASELGLPAALIIGYFVIKNLFKIPVIVILMTGLVDHYWLTLHQNILLLVVLLALIKIQSYDHE